MHRRLLSLTRDTRSALALTILSGFFAGLLTIWQAWLLSSTIKQVFLDGQTLYEVSKLLQLILIAIGGRALLTWLNEISANAVAVRIKTDLRNRLFEHILKLGPAYARGQRTGELTAAAVQGIEALDAYFSQYLPQLVITTLVPLSILVFVFPIDLLSGIVFIITAPLIPFFMIMIGKGAEIVTKKQYETLRLLSAHFLDSLQGLTTLKLFGQSRAQTRTIEIVSNKFRDTTLSVLRITFLSALALELLATLSTAIIAVEIGFRLLYDRMEFLPALFLLVLAPEFYMPLRALGARFHAGMSGTTAAKRIYEILDTVPERNLEEEQSSAARVGEIVFENLSYTYPGESKPALTDINLSIPQGSRFALVGPSGAGKSTLINLLLGFIKPSSGRLAFKDDHLQFHDGPPSIQQIAWVPQKPFLFHDTIAANISLANPNASTEQIHAAARSAYLHDFIKSLPQKYETVIGEGGARLSSGQAQRLALARAFLKDAPILILDEPTSSLDPETEALLEESTQRLMQGRTVLTIAHRLNTIYKANQILVLDTGRLIERGTHDELISLRGAYAAMVGVQDGIVSGLQQGSAQAKVEIPAETAELIPHEERFSEQARANANVFSRLLQFLQGSWNRVALSVVIGAGTIGSSVALMGTSAWLISTAALHPSIADLGVSVVGVRFFGITRGLLRYAERLVSHDVTFRLLSRLRVWFYEKLEPLAPARLMEYRAGDLLARIVGDVETLENFYVRVISPPLTAVLVGAFTALFLGYSGLHLALTFLGFFVVLGLLLPILSQFISRRPAVQTITLRGDMQTRLVDGIQGMADLLAYGRASQRLADIASNGTAYGNAQRHMARITGLHTGTTTLLTNLGMWTILVLSIPLVSSGAIAGTMLASLALLTMAAFEAVIPLPLAAQMWNSAREAARRLFEVVDTRPAVVDPSNASVPSADARMLIISGLSFSYPGQSTPALSNVDLTLSPNKSVAIVGPSGAGKSTLANLLLRYWDYQSGEITLGSDSLRSLKQDEVRAKIGLVSQNTYFFNTSVFENLRFARGRPSREEVEAAAKSAQIHEFIMNLPRGYDTMIGEQGMRLSGGERQRLAIARTLLKDAPILILDEPTANLDPVTEMQVLETLYAMMKTRTSLLITHRLVGMENLDEILVMDKGRIVERGTHQELLASDRLYKRLWVYQNRILE